jgi:GTPase
MKPVVAIVGRPNVGKSTLFNRLTKTRDALVADMPGVTRDRLYGDAQVDDREYIVVDTGGLSGTDEGIDSLMAKQVFIAIEESDIVLFLLDGRSGLTGFDQTIAQQLRLTGKKVHVLINKTEGMNTDVVESEFYSLGLGTPYAVSASHGEGINELISELILALPEDQYPQIPEQAKDAIKLAIVGRPNVGKSTLINRMMGEERVVSYDLPGTTRDSIFIPFERDGKDYIFIDTAGVRRRSKVSQSLEKFSIIKALQAIEASNVVIMVMDAKDGLTDQDLTLLSFVLKSGRALVIAVNKWDGMEEDAKKIVKEQLDRRLPFLDFAKIHFISALHGSGVGLLYTSINKAYQSAMQNISTPDLTRMLEDAVQIHQPPMVHGRRIKLRYAHQGGQNPPVIIIHGRQVDKVPDIYTRYLIKYFRKWLKLEGTPLRVQFKIGANPYAEEKSKDNRTDKQLRKRRRHTKQLIKKYGGKKDKRK